MDTDHKNVPTIKGLEIIASVCHEANRALCEAYGDTSQVSWEDAPDWQKQSAIEGVKFFLTHPNAKPGDQHDQWMEYKLTEGWKYGPVKDSEKKEHPCIVPFNELSALDQYKDKLFIAICRALL
jgi:hypothetical protein